MAMAPMLLIFGCIAFYPELLGLGEMLFCFGLAGLGIANRCYAYEIRGKHVQSKSQDSRRDWVRIVQLGVASCVLMAFGVYFLISEWMAAE